MPPERSSALAPGAATNGAVVVRLERLRKVFGHGSDTIVAVDGIDLDIAEGEFVTLLGPSGSGKTTVLRMIAGFELPTEGRVILAGRDVTAAAPFERDVNTVFQDYALFPHMSVQQNVEYGLRVKHVPAAERRERAHEALRTVRLEHFGSRRPAQLSGGQRQRVALARALVNRPALLLLDEPLGALDLKLREQMQGELKQIQRDVGITFVFVTHDQDEALTMSDRVVVFDRGRIEQTGTPREIYERPVSEFIAGFVGTANLLRGDQARAILGKSGVFSVRPERIRVLDRSSAIGDDEVSTDGTVSESVFAGSVLRLIVDLDEGGRLTATQPSPAPGDAADRSGDLVRLAWRRDHVVAVASTAPTESVPMSSS